MTPSGVPPHEIKKAPLSGAFQFGLPSVVATMPITAAAAAEIQTDARTTPAVVAPVMVAIRAPMNIFRGRCGVTVGEAGKT
jgi:hypothetical protein